MTQSTGGSEETAGKGGDDFALLDRVRRGDRAAFSDLYRHYHPRLFGYLRRMLGNPGTVEEILDDVMFVVWKDAGKFRGNSTVSTWIFGIAYRKALTAIRNERRYRAPLVQSADTDSAVAGSTPQDEWIQVALSHLSHDHRQVVELTYYGGFSYQEIAKIAGCPVNTVKTRMFHARRRLKVLLPALANPKKEQNRERA